MGQILLCVRSILPLYVYKLAILESWLCASSLYLHNALKPKDKYKNKSNKKIRTLWATAKNAEIFFRANTYVVSYSAISSQITPFL